jgi:hypothetical protein
LGTPDANVAVNANEVRGKRLALLVQCKGDKGAEDWAVFTGIATTEPGRVVVLRDPGGPIEIPSEWLARVQPILDEESRQILLDAEFLICLSIDDLVEGADPGEYRDIGLQWPEK